MNEDLIVEDFASLVHWPINVDDAPLTKRVRRRSERADDAPPLMKRVRHNCTERKRVDKMRRLFDEVRDVLDLPATLAQVGVLQEVIEYVRQTRQVAK